MNFNYDAYDKYVKPTEVEIPDNDEPDKLFDIEDEGNPAETPQVVIPDELKAAMMNELREQILKELEVNKTKEE